MSFALGASTYSYLYSVSLEEAMTRIAGLGFRYLELLTMPPHIWAGDPEVPVRPALRSRIQDLGLELVAIGPMYFDLNLASTNPHVRAVSVREVVNNLRLAADLGAPRVVTIGGRRNPLFPAPLALTWELGRDSFAQCAKVAAEVGVTMCLEPIPYSYISTGADVRRVIEEVDSPWLRAMIDTANAHATEGVGPAVRAVGPYLDFVQISDTVKGQLRHDPVGQGEIDFVAVARLLREVGYTRPCSLELCYPADPDGGLRMSREQLQSVGFS